MSARGLDGMKLGIQHGTAVARGANGLLLLGESGSGKSDLALRMMDRGWILVGDDQLELSEQGGAIVVSAIAALAGKLEVAGLGIISVPHQPSCSLKLIVDLCADYPRFPFDAGLVSVSNYKVPLVALPAFEISSALRAELAFERALERKL